MPLIPMTENERRILNNPYKSGPRPGCNCKTCTQIADKTLIPHGAGFIYKPNPKEKAK